MRLRVGARFTLRSPQPTPGVFVIRPLLRGPERLISEHWESAPDTPFHDYTDVYANVCRRLTLPEGEYDLTYEAIVETPDQLDPYAPDANECMVADLPDDVLVYTLPSRYCLSDVLFPQAQELFGGLTPGWGRVQAICDFANGHLAFGYGSSTPTTTAADVFESGRGVCRDYAHLAITFCRALNIPARYAFGYLPDIDGPPPYAPMDFCAWFEAYLDDRWYMFDPRNNARRRGRVTIARGRDALDVAMLTTYGASQLETMIVVAEEADTANAMETDVRAFV
ncbi:MAG: transglutaminase family protein [Candidatus Eremiobacteraeota bacterium]|nr:transglutaminase family protein [Candidatus Eremiobacteraeota bacterium]